MNTRRLLRGRAQSSGRGAGAKKGGAGTGQRGASARPAGASPTPAALARQAARLLAAEADAAVAQQTRTYFKGHENIRAFGVRTPRLRAIIADLFTEVRGSWRLRDAVAFADTCLARRELELRGVGVEILGRFAKEHEACLLHRVQRWLSAGYLDNWAIVDSAAGTVVAPLLRRFPELVPELTGWSASRNLWIRRMSVVPLVPFARHGEYLDEAYGVVERLLGDAEDLMHKATGWLLREAGKTDAARLERFLLRHGPAIPRTTVRYAIERFPAAQRKRLLAATR
jgi:3-methyladenine DNA glycosylase AlkD